MPAAATKKRGHSNRSRPLNDFKTFKNRFPNMVSVLNEIIASETRSSHRKKIDLDLEAIFKMVVSRDQKISDELVTADYFVDVFKKMGLTKKMVIKLEGVAPKILDMATNQKQKGGGQGVRSLFYSIILIFIINYLLTQIHIPMSIMRPILDDALNRTTSAHTYRQQEYAEYNCDAPTQHTYGYRNGTVDRCEFNIDIRTQLNDTILFLNEHNAEPFTASNLRRLIVLMPSMVPLIAQNMPPITVIIIIIGIIQFAIVGDVVATTGLRFRDYLYPPEPRVQVPAQVPVAQVPVAQVPAQARFDSSIPRVRPLDIHPDDDDIIPESFLDPIFAEFMTDPVVAIDGQTYDRSSIVQALATRGASPMTSVPIVGLQQQVLIPNLTLRDQMTTWWKEEQRKKAAAAASAAAASAAAAATARTAAIKIQKWSRRIKPAAKPSANASTTASGAAVAASSKYKKNGGSRSRRYIYRRNRRKTKRRNIK